MLDRLLPNEPKRKSVEEYRQRFVTARAAALAPVPAPAATPTAVPTVLAPSATPAAPRPNLRPPQQSAPRSINVYQDADRPIRKPTATGTAVPIMPMAPAPYVWQGMPAMPSPGLQAMFGQQTMYRPPMGVPTTYAPRPGTLPSQPPTATSASHKRPRDESD